MAQSLLCLLCYSFSMRWWRGGEESMFFGMVMLKDKVTFLVAVALLFALEFV